MHQLSSSFVLGYHGCDLDVAERVLANESFERSLNDYDWLGHGVYFWEANPQRALDFINEVAARRVGKPNQIKKPALVGAVIDLRYCLDLMSSAGIAPLRPTYESFIEVCRLSNKPIPHNSGGSDLLRRKLDCAVINHLHTIRERAKHRPFDTVRGVFIEGERVYPESGFRQKTHIQICVRDISCIVGVFRVKDHDYFPPVIPKVSPRDQVRGFLQRILNRI